MSIDMHLVRCCYMLLSESFFFILLALQMFKRMQHYWTLYGSFPQVQINLNPNGAFLGFWVCVLKLFHKADTSSNEHHSRNSKEPAFGFCQYSLNLCFQQMYESPRFVVFLSALLKHTVPLQPIFYAQYFKVPNGLNLFLLECP